jgi:glucose-6-phosphate 1-dehydrogenase
MNKSNEKGNIDQVTKAATTTPDLGIPFESCLTEGRPDPCIIVIVGASGDLTSRKIVPALFNLYLNNGLPNSFLILGCARTRLSTREFRDSMKTALEIAGIPDDSKWQDFSASMYYHIIDYLEPISFNAMAEFLRKLDKKHGTGGNRIFYLAIPPSLYKSTAQMLGKAGLSDEGEGAHLEQTIH